MYRVFLPDGILDIASKVMFLREVKKVCSFIQSIPDSGANSIYVKLESKDGVLISGLTKEEVTNIKDSLLEKGYFDFTSLDLGNKSVEYMSWLDFSTLIK